MGAPAHSFADRLDGFVGRADKLVGITRLEGADHDLGVGKGGELHMASCLRVAMGRRYPVA